MNAGLAWPAAWRARRHGIALAGACAVLLALAAAATRGFFTAANLRDVGVAAVLLALPALGLARVLRAGEIDLSIGGQIAAGAALAAGLAEAGAPFPLALAAAALAGAMVGGVNAVLAVRLGLPSVLATLAIGLTLRESARFLAGEKAGEFHAGFQFLRESPAIGRGVVVALALALLFSGDRLARGIATRIDRAGRRGRHRAAGSGTAAGAFVLAGALGGAAACFGVVGPGDPAARALAGFDLDLFAAAVLAGALSPEAAGRLDPGRLVLAALALAVAHALGRFVHAGPAWALTIEGAVILAGCVVRAAGKWAAATPTPERGVA